MALLGRPKSGDIVRAQLRIKESKEFKVSENINAAYIIYLYLFNFSVFNSIHFFKHLFIHVHCVTIMDLPSFVINLFLFFILFVRDSIVYYFR